MEPYLKGPLSVPIERLYPDPNNPRLALEGAPGYSTAAALFDEAIQRRISEELGEAAYNVEGLVEAIIEQGWMPIDRIIVWQHPDDPDKYVVNEGNRRRLALDRVRGPELEKARKKLARMEGKSASYPPQQVEEQRELVAHLEGISADTDVLEVVPINARTVEELEHKLPRVLAVRHITGAKEWGNYAEDIWLLSRFHQLFVDKHGTAANFWDPEVIQQVAEEASLSEVKAKRQLKAASWFSHFRADWEDELPAGEEFERTDYYLFENISRKPSVRQWLGVDDNALNLPQEAEKVLFQWVFAKPRGKSADDNPNVFYRHENILLWDQMKRYDDDHGTAFATRFDVENPDDAPTMHEVEAEWLMHKARKKPHAVLDDLLRRLAEITADTLATEGRVLRVQLEQVAEYATKYIKMIEAAES
jgi:hypothetical protein